MIETFLLRATAGFIDKKEYTGKINLNVDLISNNRGGYVVLTNKTVSTLFGLAAGRCSICKIPVVERHVKIGEMAHIIAKSTRGTRGNLPLVGGRNSYENLILLCPNHHTEVDNDEASYPPDRLRRLKSEHEYYVVQVFDQQTQARSMDIGALKGLMLYLPFTQIPGLLNGIPVSFNMKLFYVEETCENFEKDFPHCRPFFDPHLERHFRSFWSNLCNFNNYFRMAFYNGSALYDTSDSDIYCSSLYVSRDLSHEQRQEVEREVRQRMEYFGDSYYGFLNFLKYNYSEVHLASFVGW